MPKTIIEWMFLSTLTVLGSMMFFPMIEEAINQQLTMQLEQVEKLTNDY